MTFFERPATIGQEACYGPPDGGRRDDRLAELFLESLTVLFESKVVVGLQVLRQPASKHCPFPGGSARHLGLGSRAPVSRRLLSQRLMVGIDTEKVFATCSLGLPASTAASTLDLRSFEYGFMPGGYHMDRYLRVSL